MAIKLSLQRWWLPNNFHNTAVPFLLKTIKTKNCWDSVELLWGKSRRATTQQSAKKMWWERSQLSHELNFFRYVSFGRALGKVVKTRFVFVLSTSSPSWESSQNFFRHFVTFLECANYTHDKMMESWVDDDEKSFLQHTHTRPQWYFIAFSPKK